MRKIAVIVLFLLSFSYSVSLAKTPLMIVIDDFGNGLKGTDAMLNLEIPLNIAVMPFLPSSKRDAEIAYEKGHEVIIHMPLEPKSGKRSWLGPKPITVDLSDEEIRQRVLEAIESVPHAKGMNNHTGSKATENERVMRVILEVCKEKGLYYVDSKTSHKSIVGKIAQELQLPYLENQMFFDHQQNRTYINKQAEKVLKDLSNKNIIISIGHVGVSGDIMVDVIKNYYPLWQENGKIMTISQYLEKDLQFLPELNNQ